MCMVCLLAVIPLLREAGSEENRCVTETNCVCVSLCMCVTSESSKELANTFAYIKQHIHNQTHPTEKHLVRPKR